MSAIVIPPEFQGTPDLSPPPSGQFDVIALQDCMNIIAAYEKAAHGSATEESVFAPVARVMMNTKYWAKSSAEVLSSWTVSQDSVNTDQKNNLQISSNNTNAFQNFVDDCIPCVGRIKLALELKPSKGLLDLYNQDIKNHLNVLTQLDTLLTNTNIFNDICALLQSLNDLCIPDLQRVLALLMASLMNINFSLSGLFGLIVSLILPLFTPFLSGITNLLEQYSALVLGPADCIINAIRQAQISTGAKIVPNSDLQTISSGLGQLETNLTSGQAYIQNKLQFYIDQLTKALTDITGGNQKYLDASTQKLQTVRLLGVVAALINLKKTGGKLCQGPKPTTSELENFFNSFLNPNASLRLAADPNGNIRIEEPQPTLYELKDNGVTIIRNNLLTQPASLTYPCSIDTTVTDVNKINKWVQEANTLD